MFKKLRLLFKKKKPVEKPTPKPKSRAKVAKPEVKKSVKKPVVKKKDLREIYKILKEPHISEKSTVFLMVFAVSPGKPITKYPCVTIPKNLAVLVRVIALFKSSNELLYFFIEL